MFPKFLKPKSESSLSTNGKLCVDKFGIMPFPLGYGKKDKKESCKERGFCKAQSALKSITAPGFSDGGC